MLERWAAANRFLPNVDKVLIESEEPLVNGGKTLPRDERVAYAAEFNQSGYLRLRHVEESLQVFNYFDPEINRAL